MRVYPSQPKASATKPRFGAGAGSLPALGRLTGMADHLSSKVNRTRSHQMILEDFFGFGVLCSAMELARGYLYGNNTPNWLAAGERLAREAGSILTDNILGGVVGLGVGAASCKLLDKSYSNTFTNFDTIALFQDLLPTAPKPGAVANNAHQQFLEALAQRISNETQGEGFSKALTSLQTIWTQGAANTKNAAQATQTEAIKLAQALNKSSFDLKLTVGSRQLVYKLDHLLDDVRLFAGHMSKQAPTQGETQWAALAQKALKNTNVLKKWKLGIGLTTAMAATFSVPMVINGFTRHFRGIKYYPGEIGLHKNDSAANTTPNASGESWIEKHFPYVSQSLKRGQWLPLLTSLVPLFAVGCFDTEARGVLNPFAKKNGARLWNMFDFVKQFPYTSPQQMGSIFAFLITARLLCTRTDNEFRERLVDSGLGWALWILGTPVIKNAVAKMLDKGWFVGEANRTLLLKKEGGLRTKAEIENLLNSELRIEEKAITQQMIASTRKANVWLSVGSSLATMVLMGVLGSFWNIYSTRRNEQEKQAKRALQTPQPPVPTPLTYTQPAMSPVTPLLNPFPAPLPAVFAPVSPFTLTAAPSAMMPNGANPPVLNPFANPVASPFYPTPS